MYLKFNVRGNWYSIKLVKELSEEQIKKLSIHMKEGVDFKCTTKCDGSEVVDKNSIAIILSEEYTSNKISPIVDILRESL